MILVIRHAKKGPDGNLTEEGKTAATILGAELHNQGYTRALTAPNDRSIQTAMAAGLEIVGECPELGIPADYEDYLNGPVVARMLEQEGKPWEKSFTRSVFEDEQFNTFYYWGLAAAKIITHRARKEKGLVMIGSSPLVELAYLVYTDGHWNDFPRCRELEGFSCTSHLGRYGPFVTFQKYRQD